MIRDEEERGKVERERDKKIEASKRERERVEKCGSEGAASGSGVTPPASVSVSSASGPCNDLKSIYPPEKQLISKHSPSMTAL